jgi:hypothetical protein
VLLESQVEPLGLPNHCRVRMARGRSAEAQGPATINVADLRLSREVIQRAVQGNLSADDVTPLHLQLDLAGEADPTVTLSSGDCDVAMEVGEAPFQALLGEPDRHRCREIVRNFASSHQRKLRIADPALGALPCETMRDPPTASVPGPRACPAPAGASHGRAHGAAGGRVAPTDAVRRTAPERESWIDALSERRRLEEPLRTPWGVVHFIGHGQLGPGQRGEISLVDDGTTRWEEADLFADLMASSPYLPRFVVLNFCSSALHGEGDLFAGLATALMRKGVPAVAGMQLRCTARPLSRSRPISTDRSPMVMTSPRRFGRAGWRCSVYDGAPRGSRRSRICAARSPCTSPRRPAVHGTGRRGRCNVGVPAPQRLRPDRPAERRLGAVAEEAGNARS